MRRGLLAVMIAGFAAFAGAALARPPIVLELYTAQGCGSCGKASADVTSLAAGEKGVIALTFGVAYWDYLGWKDSFARPEFADRQKAYDEKLGVAEVYTPQVIVDGRLQAAAIKIEDVADLLREERRALADPPQMSWRGDDKVAIGGGRRLKGGADVWLVRYDPRTADVDVKDGDNRGHTVTERNVVVQIIRLAAWRGAPLLLKLPPTPMTGLKSLVLLQGEGGGRIIGALEAKP